MKCLIVDDDELSRNIIEDLVEETDFLELVKSCESSMEAFNILRDQKIDLVFLDIEMPKMSGIELLKNLDTMPQVILITSHSEYALESYELSVTDFIVKPVAPARFLKAVSKARTVSESQSGGASDGDKTLFVKADSRLVQINTNDLLWIEALGNYVIIHTTKEKLTVHTTMKEIEAKLSDVDFIRVHRSFIVRLDKIESIEDNFIVIIGKNISIGRAYKEELIKRLNLL
jgi:DNA-binding LytR/AlgR family response regulator